MSAGDRLVARLPPGLATRDALLDAYAAALGTPWRPGTWDGLYDLLQGLWWLDASEVEVVHPDVPLAQASDRDRAIYRRLAADAERAWAERAGAERAGAERPEVRARLPDGRPATFNRTLRIILPPEEGSP